MPYDMPMSLDEVLADEEARRAAAAYLGGVGRPALDAAPQMPAPQAAQAAPDNFAALAQRYTEAQQRDRQQARENALAQGAGSAAETILGGQGVRYARGPAPREPDEAGGVLRYARAQEEIAKASRPAAPMGRAGAMTDAQAREAVRASYPEAPQPLIDNTTAGNFEQVMTDLRAKAGASERTGALTRREANEKMRLQQMAEQGNLNRSVQWARLRQDAEEGGASRELRRWMWEQEQDAKEREAADKKATKDEGQTVPAGEAASIGQSKAALNALDILGRQFEATGAAGIGGKASSLLPWDTDPVKYNDDVLAAAQAVGTILEGGKLAAGDEVKYRKMFPAAGDSLERGRNKLANVKRLVESLTGAKVEALDAAGYNVKRFKPQVPPAAPKTAPASGKVRVRQKSTGRVKELDAADAAKVLAKKSNGEPAYEKVQ